MARLCERPGCSDRAEVAYGFDAEHLVVWLDAFNVAHGARSGVLCRRHANAMVVPLNWMLDDRREPEPQLFRTPPAPVVAESPPARRRRAAPSVAVEQLRLDAVEVVSAVDADSAPAPAVAAPAPTVAAPAPDAEQLPVEPWMPQFDQNDDLKGLLNARGRLLSRAFTGSASPNDD